MKEKVQGKQTDQLMTGEKEIKAREKKIQLTSITEDQAKSVKTRYLKGKLQKIQVQSKSTKRQS